MKDGCNDMLCSTIISIHFVFKGGGRSVSKNSELELLPDEEILRRHKALPVTLVWKKALDWALSLIAALVLVLLFIGLVKIFGQVIIIAFYREYSGSLWTTPPAYVLTVCIIIQFLLVLKPTK